MWGCDRKSKVKDVSNIFGLTNWKNGVAITYVGEMTERAGWRQKSPGVWFESGWVYVVHQTLMDVSNGHLGVRLAFRTAGKHWRCDFITYKHGVNSGLSKEHKKRSR